MLLFVDLDKEIEKREGRSIADIFSQSGEAYFREVEAALLQEWAASAKGFVLATGGGAPCFHNGIQVINASGTSIFLDVPVEELVRRLRHHQDRPLLQSDDGEEKETRLRQLYATRRDCYLQAKIILPTPRLPQVLEALRHQ